MKKIIVLLLLLFSVSSLSAREFPLCLYGVTNPDDLQTIKKAGFTCIQTYTKEAATLAKLAKEAEKQGLEVVFRPEAIIGTKYEKKARHWPILAWYLVDEPDVARLTREQVQAKHQAAKKAFPHHFTALVIGQGRTATPYYDIPDIMMVDWYPVPHYPLETFGDQVGYMREEMAERNVADHPAWGVVQIFDWKNYKQYRPDNDRIGRFPTVEEIRFMSYDGIYNGATGLFFYTFNHLQNPLPQSAPEYWKRVQTVLGELAQFKTIMEKGVAVENPVRVRHPLRLKTWQYEGHTYSMLMNIDDKPRKVPSALLKPAYQILYGQEKTKKMPAYAVWILKK